MQANIHVHVTLTHTEHRHTHTHTHTADIENVSIQQKRTILFSCIQLMSEATAEHRSSVNYTVFHCKAMQAYHSVAVLLSSPNSPEPQASEWREFFSPDIQSRLLPTFLNNASQLHHSTASTSLYLSSIRPPLLSILSSPLSI